MDKSPKQPKKNYWGLTRDKKIVFEGTFNECWKELTRLYGTWLVRELENNAIKIERIN